MTDTWHNSSTRRIKRHRRRPCLHCVNGMRGNHYLCREDRPCQDCVDEVLTIAEDRANAFDGDDSYEYEYDRDLEHPWNMYA